ncbi:MAG: hypothetical protein V1890_01280 [Candidatus Zixiibacteriota bacterium]
MKIFKFILAFILTLFLLAVARKISTREPEHLAVTNDSISLSHTTVTAKVGEGEVRIDATLKTPEPLENYSFELFYRIGKGKGEYKSLKMELIEGTTDQFVAFIPSQPKGKRAYYYLSLSGNQGKEILTLPEKVNLLNDPLLIKFKGKVSPVIIGSHVLAMFGSVFFVFLVMVSAFEIIFNKDSIRQLSIYTLWATILSFLGGVPLGILVTNQAFGEIWGGFPIFTDITDSKTSILIFYWAIVLLFMKGSTFKKDKNFNLLPEKALAWFAILGFILTLAIYLIPHSI